jgi:hypothetical protein
VSGGGQPQVERKTRVRHGPLPKVEPTVAIPYANTRGDAPTAAQVVRAMLDSSAFRAVIKPELDRLEAERQSRKKVKPAYTCEELESVFLYQVVCGLETVRETRAHLTSHEGAEARRLLGFDRRRQSKGQVTTMHSVPSEATLCRYRLSFAPKDAGRIRAATRESVAAGETPTVYDFKRAEVARLRAATRARRDLYQRFLACFVEHYLKTPEADEAAHALFVDGTSLITYFNCLTTKNEEDEEDEEAVPGSGGERNPVPQNDEPRKRKRCRVKPIFDETGKMVWDGLLTEEQWEALAEQDPTFRRYWKYSADGGYLSMEAGEHRGGHGYSVVSVVDADGMPLGFDVDRINTPGERAQATKLLGELRAALALLPADEKVRVLSADAGFTGYDVRNAIREIGLLENIHPVSGSREARSVEHDARRLGARRRVIHKDSGRDTWLTDGHCNLFCECGQGEVQKRFHRTAKGRLVPRLEGQCDSCGPITITSGDWKYSDKKWRHRVKHPGGEPELQMGNPLTFSNPISKELAKRRFAVHEGVHSILATRFPLLSGRQRIKYREDAELRVAMTFCALHAIAYARAKLAQAPAAPPQRLAA